MGRQLRLPTRYDLLKEYTVNIYIYTKGLPPLPPNPEDWIEALKSIRRLVGPQVKHVGAACWQAKHELPCYIFLNG